jgi:hypothetical protein
MSIIRFQHGIGPGRLIDGVIRIIFILEFLVWDLPAAGCERLQAKETGFFSLLTLGLQRRR